jgi:hypothetical protein
MKEEIEIMKKYDVKEIRKIIMEACKSYQNVNWYGIALLMNKETGNISYVQIAGNNEFTQGEHNGTQIRINNIYNKNRINYLEEARQSLIDLGLEDEDR